MMTDTFPLQTSVPMSLGVRGSDYLTRSTIPAGGLSLLISEYLVVAHI